MVSRMEVALYLQESDFFAYSGGVFFVWFSGWHNETQFERVAVIVDAIGLTLESSVVPDRHNFIARKKLVKIASGVGTNRDLITK